MYVDSRVLTLYRILTINFFTTISLCHSDSTTSQCISTSSNVLSHDYANASDCLERFDHQIPSLFPISITELGSWVAELHKNSNRGFTEQYEVGNSQFCMTVHNDLLLV